MRSLAVEVKIYMVGFKIHRSFGDPFPSVVHKLSPNYAIKCILTNRMAIGDSNKTITKIHIRVMCVAN